MRLNLYESICDDEHLLKEYRNMRDALIAAAEAFLFYSGGSFPAYDLDGGSRAREALAKIKEVYTNP